MGYGDELMAAGQAMSLFDYHGGQKRVVILDAKGQPRRHELWEYCSYVALPDDMGKDEQFLFIVNGPNVRPYVDMLAMRKNFERVFPGRPFTTKVFDRRLPWVYDMRHRAQPPILDLFERGKYHGNVVIEPHVKMSVAPNKDWGWDRWQRLVHLAPEVPWVQLGRPGARLLDGVGYHQTDTYTEAMRYLSGASAAVLPEGGLHHAAAAMGVRAVVIYGGFTSPIITGYPTHVNLAYDEWNPCGQKLAGCEHCKVAMESITPEAVLDHLFTMVPYPPDRRQNE